MAMRHNMNQTMKSILTIFAVIFFITTASPLLSQDNGEEINLAAIADNQKFENAKHFYDMKLYDKSLREMNEYLEIYATGAHRKAAFMTVGSIHFKRFDYPRAVKAYSSLYEEFSNSEEGIQAYFNVAICYQKMGRDKKAREILKEIIEDHPDTRESAMARTQMDLLDIIDR